MNRTELINRVCKEYSKSLRPDSKFYKEDMDHFRTEVSKKTTKEIEEHLNRLTFFHSKTMDKIVDREMRKLDRGGMFDVRKMKPGNQLD